MKAYISVSFSKRKLVDQELNAIVDTLNDFDISSLIFVDHYTFDASQEQQMMEQAMNDINHCDLLIAETSHKGIGIGVEVGYAKARGKTVIYLRQQDAEHSTTVSGISDFQIIYIDVIDLKRQMRNVLGRIVKSV